MEKSLPPSTTREIKPPITNIGIIGWMRANLFNGWFNTTLTLVFTYVLYLTVPPFVEWAFINSNWITTC